MPVGQLSYFYGFFKKLVETLVTVNDAALHAGLDHAVTIRHRLKERLGRDRVLLPGSSSNFTVSSTTWPFSGRPSNSKVPMIRSGARPRGSRHGSQTRCHADLYGCSASGLRWWARRLQASW